MYLNIFRHGPKNNDPQAHQTGVEALLDPGRIYEIITDAATTLENIPHANERARNLYRGTQRIRVETTPIDRAIATGNIQHTIFSLDPSCTVPQPAVNELIGSSGIHPQTGKAVNLVPRAMSDLWAAAKKDERYTDFQGEHGPLYAWCEQGFDNPQANNSHDPGISLREVACRLGTYIYNTLDHGDPHDLVLAIGHSGDIGPFLYLTLEMLAGRDGTARDALTRHFHTTRGALEPLTGIRFYESGSRALRMQHFCGAPQDPATVIEITVGREILQEQARWFRENGRSSEVLEKKIGSLPAAIHVDHGPAPLSLPNISAIIERECGGGKEVLVGTRWKPQSDPVYSGCLEIPAGHIDAFEPVYDTIRREVLEETGLTVKAIKPDVQTKVHRTSRGDAAFAFVPLCGQQQLKGGKPWVAYTFICTVEDTSPTPNLAEVKDLHWMRYEELRRLFDEEPERIFTFQLPALDFYFNYEEVYGSLIKRG